MCAVLQRATEPVVAVDGETIGRIGRGWLSCWAWAIAIRQSSPTSSPTVVCNFDPADKNGCNPTRRPVRIHISAHILDP